MVKVNIVENVTEFSMTMSGHAEFAETNDIVCSAISALAFTLIGALENEAGITLKHIENHGDLAVNVVVKDIHKVNTIETIFKTIKIGLLQIQETYPKNILVKY